MADGDAQWSAYAKPGPYTTTLPQQDEQQFKSWVKNNNIPWRDSPQSDYDMRGYWKAQVSGDSSAHTEVNPVDHKPHYPDTYKTPYHKTFSNESKYALPTAGHWEGQRFIAPSMSTLPSPASSWMMGANAGPQPASMTTEPAQPEMADTATAGLSGNAPGSKAPVQQQPEPHVSVARHILEALGGAAGPMGWAKSVIAGGLAGAANVGTVPEGGGALTGAARGVAGYQQLQRQQALDAQAKQKEQFEQQMKQKADARAEQALQNQTLETNAQVATANARTLATIHEDQRAQALAPYMEEEKRVNLDNIHDARAKSAAEIKAIAIRAGVDPKDLEESHTSYDNATPQQVHSIGSGDTLLLHNGEVAKQGEDGVGVHAVSGGINLFDKPLKTDTKVISGYEFDAKGNPVPKFTTMSAGHTVADAYALYLAAQEDLSSHQAQLTAAADLSKKQSEAKTAGVTAEHAEANQRLEARSKEAEIGLKGAEAGKATAEAKKEELEASQLQALNPTGSEGLSGEAYLKTLPESTQNTFKAASEGRGKEIMIQNRKGEFTPAGQAFMRAYPDYDIAKAHEYPKLLTEFTSGQTGKTIVSMGAAINHTRAAYDNTGAASFIPGTAENKRYNQDVTFVSEELGKYLKGGVAGEGEVKEIQNGIKSHIPWLRKAALENAAHIFEGKRSELEQQWKNGQVRPSYQPPMPNMSPDAEANLSYLRTGGSEPPRPKSVPTNAVWNKEANQWQLPQPQ